MSESQVNFILSPQKCKNDTVQLIANTGTLTNPSFTWVCIPTGAVLSAPNNSATGLIFQNTGAYTISLFVASTTGSFSAQHAATVNPLPSINLTSSSLTTCIIVNTLPNSKPVVLNATGGISYTWTPPNGSMTGGQNGPFSTFRPLTNTCFSVVGVDANGCKNQAVSCVSVLPRFTIDATPINATLCLGGPSDEYITLKAFNPSSPAFGLPASHKYFWSGGQSAGILTTPLSQSVAVAPTNSYTFTVEMVDSMGCISFPKLVPVFVQFCTGLKTEQLSEQLKFYPNPVKDKFTIDLGKVNESECRIILLNAHGQRQAVTTKQIKDHEIEVDFTNVAPGLYFIKVEGTKGDSTLKVLKE